MKQQATSDREVDGSRTSPSGGWWHTKMKIDVWRCASMGKIFREGEQDTLFSMGEAPGGWAEGRDPGMLSVESLQDQPTAA